MNSSTQAPPAHRLDAVVAAAAPALSPAPRVGGWSLSRSLLALVIGTATLALILVLGLMLSWRLPAVQAQSRELVKQESAAMASRSELLLSSVQQRLQQLATVLVATVPEISVALVARTLGDDDLVDVMAVTTPAGAVQAAGL